MLIGVLKHGGHNVELFDITFMVQKRLDHDAREKTGTVKPVDYTKYWGTPIQVDIYQELRNKIKDFKPDLVAFSIVESNYSIAKKCFEVVKSETSVPIIVGGVFPTIAPKFFYDDKNVDIICIGEGEQCLLELANKLDKKESYSNILNLHVKTNLYPKIGICLIRDIYGKHTMEKCGNVDVLNYLEDVHIIVRIVTIMFFKKHLKI